MQKLFWGVTKLDMSLLSGEEQDRPRVRTCTQAVSATLV